MPVNPFASFAGRTGGGNTGNPFGSIPGPIAVPPNLFAQTAGVVPNLGGLASGAGRFAGTEIAGQLSPETLRTLQDEGAAWGVGAGMPGFTPGSLVQNRSLRNLGLNVEDTQRKGTQDFLSLLTGIGGSMTNPALAADIANRNSIFAAAPDPAAAAQEQLRQWMQKFNLTQGYGGRSLNWADMFGGGNAGIAPGFGTGRSNFLSGFDPGLGGPPMGPTYGATGPFTSSPAGGTGSYTLTGNTIGGGPTAHDSVLDAFFNPEDYFWGQPGEGTASTSSTMGPL